MKALLLSVLLVGCGAAAPEDITEPMPDAGSDAMAQADALPHTADSQVQADAMQADAQPQGECTVTAVNTDDDCPNTDPNPAAGYPYGRPQTCIENHCVECGLKSQPGCHGEQFSGRITTDHHCFDPDFGPVQCMVNGQRYESTSNATDCTCCHWQIVGQNVVYDCSQP